MARRLLNSPRSDSRFKQQTAWIKNKSIRLVTGSIFPQRICVPRCCTYWVGLKKEENKMKLKSTFVAAVFAAILMAPGAKAVLVIDNPADFAIAGASNPTDAQVAAAIGITTAQLGPML